VQNEKLADSATVQASLLARIERVESGGAAGPAMGAAPPLLLRHRTWRRPHSRLVEGDCSVKQYASVCDGYKRCAR
jgi:hypothetical protein